MTEPVLSRVAEARTFLSKLWKLAAPYWWARRQGRDRDRAVPCCHGRALDRARAAARCSILWQSSLSISASCSTTGMAASTMRLQEKNAANVLGARSADFFRFLAFVFIIVVRSTGSGCGSIWRSAGGSWLTGVYTRTWLAGSNTYYRMELTGHGADNPEQRIEKDIADFTRQTLFLTLDLHLRDDDAGHVLGISCGTCRARSGA